MDTYLEGYHFASPHPTNINLINYDNSMVFDGFGSHSRQGFPVRNLLDLKGIPECEWDVHRHLTTVYQLFLNVAFTVSPEGILINAVYPGGASTSPSRCRPTTAPRRSPPTRSAPRCSTGPTSSVRW